MNDFFPAAPLWSPSENFSRDSCMYRYMNGLKEEKNLHFQSYNELYQWSVSRPAEFWESVLRFFEIVYDGHYNEVAHIPDSGMIGTRWFEGINVSYAEHVFRFHSEPSPAIVFKSENSSLIEISRDELYSRVAALADYLRKSGVVPGDRIAAFLPNVPEAIIAFLAANSIGAVWSACSPDFGTASVIDRFFQIEPKILFAGDGYSYNGKSYPKTEALHELTQALPSLEKIIFLPLMNPASRVENPKVVFWSETQSENPPPLVFTRIPFNDPLWILYSSGTTGKPKAITQSAGGCLIEHVKALGFHQNVKPGDRFFWYSTTGWMMWNYTVAAMLTGGTAVIYDGAAGFPDLNVLWNFAGEAKVNHFGAGAAFYIACMKAGLELRHSEITRYLQSVGSTGSPLPPEAFRWIYAAIKPDLWLISLSGGTDVCSGFVGGSPLLPVYAGEIQCRMLGAKVEAFNETGQSVADELGEMVILHPMPSMPVFFWDDPGNERYFNSYFDVYPGLWRHGDWIKITERGSVIIYGRSDATLNRGGVRIGTSEVYRAVESIPEVLDSMVICIEKEGGEFFMPLFVVLREGEKLDDELKKRINFALRDQFSPRHVPDAIFQTGEIPYTISGKKMETPVKKILMGTPILKAVSKDAMKNPASLDYFVLFAQTFNAR
ncbi:MAG: acetoacetate--CoA ligase [Bacteroidia bacterium]|nr:acetoacetate--CoA ligase [Bacteroidia bacterium]